MESDQITVLAIDDTADNLLSLKAVLAEHLPHAKVLTADSGARGMEIARAEDPDVILLDVLMPEMDGYAVCRAVKKDERLQRIPVLFLTALRSDRESRIRGLEAGAEGFLTIPFEPAELLAQIRAMVRIKSAYRLQHQEKERLAGLVAQRTRELERKLEEHKRSEAALRESEERFRLLIERAPEAIFVQSKGRFLYANKRMLDLLGAHQPADLLGQELMHRIAPECRDVVRERIAFQQKTGKVAPAMEEQYLRLDGARVPVEVTAVAIRYQDQDAHLVFVRDVTLRRQAEEATKKSEIRYRELFDKMSSGVAVYMAVNNGADFVFLDFNLAGERIDGESRNLLIGRRLTQVRPGIAKFGLLDVLRRVWRTGTSERFPVGLYEDDRRRKWYENYVYRLPSGEVVSVFDDVSERVIAEQELAREKRSFQSLTENSPDVIARFDRDGRHLYVNPVIERLTGLSPASFVGKTNEELGMPAHLCDQWKAVMQKTFAGERPPSYQFSFHCTDGIARIFDCVMVPEFSPDGTVATVLSIARDVTERHQAEQQLRQSADQIKRMMNGTIKAITSAVEARDPYTAGHERRVAQLAGAIAARMGLPESQVEGIRIAGYMHDIGKIAVPAEILSRPGRISAMEFGIIKCHAQCGYDILKEIDFVWPVAQAAYQHHERLDGSGYPQALAGDKIILEARILAVADVVEAMSSHRPYRAALGIDKALEEITARKGAFYDPAAVDACLALFQTDGFAFDR